MTTYALHVKSVAHFGSIFTRKRIYTVQAFIILVHDDVAAIDLICLKGHYSETRSCGIVITGINYVSIQLAFFL